MDEPLSKSPQDWIRHSLMVAQRALPRDVPVGAVLVSAQGEVLAEGWNTRERDHDPTGHAELMALRVAAQSQGDWRLDGATLYVTLEPCPMCASALLQARVAAVVFGAPDPVQGAMGSAINLGLLAPKPPKVTAGVLEAECRAQLNAFFKTLRQA